MMTLKMLMPERIRAEASEKEAGTKQLSIAVIVIFFLLNLIFLLLFSDRGGVGFKGDDLESIVPMFHLNEVKQGALLAYRYDWQPLSYVLGAAVFQVTRSPAAIFMLAPIACALSLTLLLIITWRERLSMATLTASLVALLAVPEFWFSGLYYNSTIIGLPLVLSSFALLRAQVFGPLALLAGFLTGAAILMRLDFALACPALALVAWQEDRSLTRPIIFTLGVLMVLALAFFAGIFDPVKALEVFRSSSAEILEKANTPGWDRRKKLLVLTVMLSSVGWVILLLGGPVVAYQALRRDKIMVLLWVLAIAPLTLPLPELLSVKYALPLLIFLPPFLVQCLCAIGAMVPGKIQEWPLRLSAAGTAALLAGFFQRIWKGAILADWNARLPACRHA